MKEIKNLKLFSRALKEENEKYPIKLVNTIYHKTIIKLVSSNKNSLNQD